MFKLTTIGVLFFCLACADTVTADRSEDSSPMLMSPVDEKGDLSTSVRFKGRLRWERPSESTLEGMFEFHTYFFEVRTPAEISLEITHLGSASGLNTSLFLYGPESLGGGIGPLLASDDDSGYGRLSMLAAVQIPQGGRYNVVVGTPDGQSYGHYRLVLSSEDEACFCEGVSCVTWPEDELSLLESALNQTMSELFEGEEGLFASCYRDVYKYEVTSPAANPTPRQAMDAIKPLVQQRNARSMGVETACLEDEACLQDLELLEEWTYLETSLPELERSLDMWGVNPDSFLAALDADGSFQLGSTLYSYFKGCQEHMSCVGTITYLLFDDPNILYAVDLGCFEGD